MKKNFILLLLALIVLASCKTREKVIYLQDATAYETVQTQALTTLKLTPGDKIGVTVTSAATPELAIRYNLNTGTNYSSTQNADNLRYTVDENGNIDMLGVGRIQVGGLTRSEAAEKIQKAFRNGLLNDAIVTVSAYNQYITILGDVSKPGRYSISRDNITIFDAIGMAGDLNITGRRDAIKVIRQEGAESKTYFVDLRSKDILNSPVYNLQQNDIIYVEPNDVKVRQSTTNGNSARSITTWLSVSSVLISVATLVTTIVLNKK